MNPYLVAVAALLGALATAIPGLIQQAIVPNKVVTAIITAIIAAAGVAVSFNYSGATSPIAYFIAFLSGAGVGTAGVFTATGSAKATLKRQQLTKAPKK
jgi:hypothetical protein